MRLYALKNKYPLSFRGVKCDIVGMGISNVALAEYLYKEGAKITVRDKETPSPIIQAHLQQISARQFYGSDYLTDLDGEYIFRSPSVRPDIAEFTTALSSGATVGAEWELFFHRAPCDIFAVTGSDGKTTTVTLTEKILALSQGKKQVFAAGNIGTPLISLLEEITINDIIIAELSSFQLMTFDAIPTVSAITNITPNHLDYHRDMTEYINSKLNISDPQRSKTVFHPSHIPQEILSHFKNANNVISCGFKDTNTIYCYNNQIFVHNIPILNSQNIKLKGTHNIENYMTAIGLCGNLASEDAINEVASTFEGVDHRMQFIAEKNGIKYYDSSIDSTPSRTAATLQAMTIKPTVICGGHDKCLTYDLLADTLNKNAYAVVVTGASAPKILEEIYRIPNRNFLCFYEEDFEKAVIRSANITPRGGAVLLSPACASFDCFKDYKERGIFFQKIVNSLPDN